MLPIPSIQIGGDPQIKYLCTAIHVCFPANWNVIFNFTSHSTSSSTEKEGMCTAISEGDPFYNLQGLQYGFNCHSYNNY